MLYKDLFEKTASKEEKIERYLKFREYISTHNCFIGKRLRVLINRACELIARGLDDQYLPTLELRIRGVVVNHFRNSACNEGVTANLMIRRMKNMENNLLHCMRCNKIKTVDRFTLNSRMESVKICAHCSWMDKAKEPWIDLSPYRWDV